MECIEEVKKMFVKASDLEVLVESISESIEKLTDTSATESDRGKFESIHRMRLALRKDMREYIVHTRSADSIGRGFLIVAKYLLRRINLYSRILEKMTSLACFATYMKLNLKEKKHQIHFMAGTEITNMGTTSMLSYLEHQLEQ